MRKPSTQMPPTWQCYLNLCKFNVVVEDGVYLDSRYATGAELTALIDTGYGNLGIALAAASAAAVNHYVDRDIGKKLNPHRPIPMVI